MDGWSGWGVVVVVEACGCKGRRKGKERGRSLLMGMGGVCGRGGRRKEGGRKGEGGEEATDSIEQLSEAILFFWLGSSLSQN